MFPYLLIKWLIFFNVNTLWLKIFCLYQILNCESSSRECTKMIISCFSLLVAGGGVQDPSKTLETLNVFTMAKTRTKNPPETPFADVWASYHWKAGRKLRGDPVQVAHSLLRKLQWGKVTRERERVAERSCVDSSRAVVHSARGCWGLLASLGILAWLLLSSSGPRFLHFWSGSNK